MSAGLCVVTAVFEAGWVLGTFSEYPTCLRDSKHPEPSINHLGRVTQFLGPWLPENEKQENLLELGNFIFPFCPITNALVLFP